MQVRKAKPTPSICDADHSGPGKFSIYLKQELSNFLAVRGVDMSGGVFISYRREDAAGFAGRIYDRLTNALGRESVFIDVDNIPAGLDFVDVLSERVGRCDALIAIIGRNWLASADKNNLRRLDDPSDFVRVEIEAALNRNVPVIPVLVDGAVIPQADDLPDGLKKLARRQGIEISHSSFDFDAERLTDALARIEGKKLSPAGARRPAPVPKPQGGPARWLLAAAGVVAMAGGAVFFYAPRGAHEEQSRREEKAKPTSDVLKTLPLPQTTSTFKAPELNVAPNQTATGAADNSGPANTANAVNPARDATPTGTIADSPPAAPAKAGATIAPTALREWTDLEDFRAELNQKLHMYLIYPTEIEARCQNGAMQRRVASWLPLRSGQQFAVTLSAEKDVKSAEAIQTTRGFTRIFDTKFEDCDGVMSHVEGWMKER